MKDIALILGCLGLLLSVVAVIAAVVDRRNRRRT